MNTSMVDWLNNVHKNSSHNVFKDVIRIKGAEVKPMDDGQVVLISEINRIIFSLETSSGKVKELKAIAKTEAPPGPGRSIADGSSVFKTETLMYTEVLKNMEKIMSEDADKAYHWAECYHSADNKFLFEDLCETGYRIVPVQSFLDYDHTMLVMEALGKFHGLSMVLKGRGMLDASKFNSCYFADRMPFMINLHKISIVGLAKVMKLLWSSEWLPAAERLEKKVEDPGEAMYNMYQSSKSQWEVLNHGDFSIRNMLFHYQPGSSKPDGIKFVDFQMCHYSHLGYDLVTLLYSSLLPTVRDENMNHFLQTYASSLSKTCSTFGYKGLVPSVEDVRTCIKSLSYLTTLTPLCCIPFAMACRKESLQQKVDDNLQKLTDKNLEIENEISEDERIYLTDPETVELLQYEIKRCLNDNSI